MWIKRIVNLCKKENVLCGGAKKIELKIVYLLLPLFCYTYRYAIRIYILNHEQQQKMSQIKMSSS